MGALLAIALILPTGPPAAAGTTGQKLLAKINAARKRHGVGPLRASPALERSSRSYACRMLRGNFFGHQAHVSAPHKFVQRGEALAMTSGLRLRWRVAYRGWMQSASHRVLLMSGTFNWIGIGSCRGTMRSHRAVTWVAHVGRL